MVSWRAWQNKYIWSSWAAHIKLYALDTEYIMMFLYKV